MGCVRVCVGAIPQKSGPVYIKKTESGVQKKSKALRQDPTFLDLIFVPFSMLYPKKSKIVQEPTFMVWSITLETYTGPYFSGVLHTQGPTFRAPFFERALLRPYG